MQAFSITASAALSGLPPLLLCLLVPGGHAPSTAQHSVALSQDELHCICGSQMPSGHAITFCQVSNQLLARPDTHRFNQFISQCPVPSAPPINQLVNQVPHEQINLVNQFQYS